jgi:hypothetical protein
MRRECARSADVAAAVAAGGGASLPPPPGFGEARRSASREGGRACDPDDGDTDLHEHVAGCPSCADLLLVMSSLRSEWDTSRRTAPVPSAGLVWWRAQLKQRQAAARAASAPVTGLHAITLALALVFAVFLAWTVGRTVGMPAALSLPALPAWTIAPGSEAGDAPSLARYGVILAATAWLILAPVALYFALRRD